MALTWTPAAPWWSSGRLHLMIVRVPRAGALLALRRTWNSSGGMATRVTKVASGHSRKRFSRQGHGRELRRQVRLAGSRLLQVEEGVTSAMVGRLRESRWAGCAIKA